MAIEKKTNHSRNNFALLVFDILEAYGVQRFERVEASPHIQINQLRGSGHVCQKIIQNIQQTVALFAIGKLGWVEPFGER